MAITANTDPLPREMQQHTYSIMYEVEGAHWWFVGRRRIIAGFVEGICREIGKRRPRILDVGCGTGANLQMLSQFGVAEGVDVSPAALDFCRARGLARCGRLGFGHLHREARRVVPRELRVPAEQREHPAPASFDLVTGLDVVEHLDDDVAGLREMHRVLRPGGYALLFVPAFKFLWGVQDDISHHRRRYTLPELKRTAEQAGLTIDRATYANITFFAPILLGRMLMRLTGFRPTSENNLTLGVMNGLLGRILGAESSILRHANLPFGVSAICVARRID